MFVKNLGRADRIIRATAGVGLFAVGLVFKTWWGLLGIIPLGTAVTGFCGLYKPFGLSTCRQKQPT